VIIVFPDFIVDGHIDSFYKYVKNNNLKFANSNSDMHVDLPGLKQANIGLEVFAVYINKKSLNEDPFIFASKYIKKYKKIINSIEDLYLVKNYNNILNNMDKIGVIISIEGGTPIYDIKSLEELYEMGVRLITLTWNYRNQLAWGIKERNGDEGLTDLGIKVVNKMNELGMVIDVSHLSLLSFWDVIKYSKKPIVASHSNASSICDHPRNLNDEQIKAIAEKQGLIGINFYPLFLNNSHKAEVSDIIKHIRYIKDLVGINHIGLGTDYDGISVTPVGLEDISKIGLLYSELVARGFTVKELSKFFYKNWLNLFKNILG